MKNGRIIKDKGTTIYKQFFYSFLGVLILPIVIFAICFFYYNQKIYEDKILERMEQSMNVSVQALEGHLDNLYMTMQYHSNMYYMQDRIVAKDIFGFDIRDALASEAATNSFLDGICYYNSMMSKRIYTEAGTYNRNYYSEVYLLMDENTFLEKLALIEDRGWLSVKMENEDGSITIPRVYYVVKGLGKNDWWLFKLSKKSLNNIFLEYDMQVTLLDSSGELIYETSSYIDEMIKVKESLIMEQESSDGEFSLVKNISKQQVFTEVITFRTIFVIVIIIVLLLGSAVVIALTNYHIQPIYELREYCESKELIIPESASGLGVFLFTIKSMDMQIEMLNEKKKKDRVLLQMLWDIDCNTKEFHEKLQNTGIFQNVKYYRVAIVLYQDTCKDYLLKGYQELTLIDGCEMHVLDTMTGNRNIIIWGLNDDANSDLEIELENMIENINLYCPNTLQICVGELGLGIEHIRLSYKQALSCRKIDNNSNTSGVIYYEAAIIEEPEQDDTRIIEKICEYIEENIDLYDLNVSFVADYFNISISNLSHQFKRQVGQTISEYITEKKFNYAAKLLRETDYSVLMIATTLGYSQSASFIRKFKSIYGMTPVNYRNENGIIIDKQNNN